MNIFSLLAHAGLLIHCEKDVQSIVENLIQHKESFPSKDEFVELIDDALSLLNAGLIDLPDDVVKKMQESFAALKDGLK